MSILIANIGTSDLAIKINVNGQQRYFNVLIILDTAISETVKSHLSPILVEILLWIKTYLIQKGTGLKVSWYMVL
ncbi:hypothetical protein [Cylindrospermopsis raciborskii]|uniref:Uncharacterized protein n=1 Tax=Cylindrospermopsis raciborskii CS-505 TaxID=533240 RepID=A0A853MCT4_9CYAN|nr:hypothetical protein [Cylindrospermopsis raciborskii]EFA68330.1 hypothetical protein CRC_03152 [Cylindrospermopsis raciborskii CS-505]OBU76235.1 hypothetical protein A9P98_07800 [Cylindrospermopsis raciborskii CS-505]